MTLSSFLKQNALSIENMKYVASKRFLDDKKKPVEWELRTISSSIDNELKKSCYRQSVRQNKVNVEFDAQLYQAKLCAACVVYPDLNNAELQNSYGVMNAHELLGEMLLPAEFDNLTAKIFELTGKNESFDEQVEAIKN